LNPFDLAGRVAIVTGGNGGLGLAMARGLARAGALIALAARDENKGQAAVKELISSAPATRFYAFQASSASSCRKLIETVVGDFGAYFGHIPQSFTGELYSFGPRFYLRKPGSRFVPFGQALFGGSHFSMSPPGISGGGTQFAFGLGGGGDITLKHNGRFALRGQAEYFGIRTNGDTTPCTRLSVGIVYRLGSGRAAGS